MSASATGMRAVHVRIRRAVDDAGWMNEQLEASEPGTGGEQEEEHGGEERQMSPHRRASSRAVKMVR